MIDKMEHPESSTLGGYFYRTQDANIDTEHIKMFLNYQKDNKIFTVDTAARESIMRVLGASGEHLYTQAEKLIKLIENRRNMIL